ncbi:MAG: UvrB/UvrC motif-containing protein [Kiritimatiellae bacterium]|nr:UvrB/UvrC motif-containing protein [Kiritimatiellia bacterium]
MSKDLASIMSGWGYDPNEVRARYVRVADGTQQIQLRLDLGIFQMHLEGRPDGESPRGLTSLRDYYVEEELRAPDQTLPNGLDPAACADLQQEVMQYYYRMMAFHALGELGGVVRDSDHILDLIDIVSEYADDDEVAWQFMQLYPYMRMMNIRARTEMDLQQGRFAQADKVVREAVLDLEHFYADNFEPTNEDGSPVPPAPELESLRELVREIDRRRPRSEAEMLQQALAHAVELEHYEKAAFLRDRLKNLSLFGSRSPAKKRLHPPGDRESAN